jgi:hypothetical protein
VESTARRLDMAARTYTEMADAVQPGRFQTAPEATRALRTRLLAELKKE